MKILLTTIDGGGNIPPVLGTARRLKQRGHDVTVLSEPCMEPAVREAGLDFMPFGTHYTRTDRSEDIICDANTNMFTNPFLDQVVFGPAAVQVAETLAAIDRTHADMLLADCLLPVSAMAAEKRGIPCTVLFHMPEYFPGPNRPPGIMGLNPGRGMTGKLRDRLLGGIFHLKLNSYLKNINRVRRDLELSELKGTRELVDSTAMRLIQTLREFDFPILPAPANVRYSAPVLDDPDWTGGTWQSPWTADDKRPLVVVSLSSTFQDQAGTLQNIMRALGAMPVRGLVTLGPAMATVSFDVPGNVHVVDSAPHSAVFPQADLVVTHAGHGTLMRALSFGLPLLCMPMGRDQMDNAAKVAYHGLGLKRKPGSQPADIQRAVSELLQNPAYREQAQSFAQKIKQAVAQDASISWIEELGQRR